MTRTHYLILAAFALSFLAGCATNAGGETNALSGTLRAAEGRIARTQQDAKAIVGLVHGASNLQRRIDFKTARALRLLDR